MNKTLINYLGLLGILSLISYAAAVIFSPLAYPGYDWMSQAVSNLSASNAPSAVLWDQLAAVYNSCSIVCVTVVCIFIQGKLSKSLRTGIYLFSVMTWISKIGYTAFPLSDSGNAGTFRDIMHIYIVTPLVVLLSISSLIVIIIGGLRSKNKLRSLGFFAAAALAMMFIGAFGTMAAPKAYFGIFERFSVFSATGFTAVLGWFLYNGFYRNSERRYVQET